MPGPGQFFEKLDKNHSGFLTWQAQKQKSLGRWNSNEDGFGVEGKPIGNHGFFVSSNIGGSCKCSHHPIL
jgi:hypothetical protein